MAGGLPSTEPRPQTAGVQDRIVVQPVHNQTLVSVRAGPRQGGRELPRGAQARLEVRGPSSQPAARPPPLGRICVPRSQGWLRSASPHPHLRCLCFPGAGGLGCRFSESHPVRSRLGLQQCGRGQAGKAGRHGHYVSCSSRRQSWGCADFRGMDVPRWQLPSGLRALTLVLQHPRTSATVFCSSFSFVLSEWPVVASSARGPPSPPPIS